MLDARSPVPMPVEPAAPESLSLRYWLMFVVITGSGLFDLFDIFIVGFIIAKLGSEWTLSYGQAAIMLMAGGIGAILGALASGILADRFGRRLVFLVTTAITGLASLALASLPSGAWIAFCLLRAVIGFGAAGATTVQSAMIVEFTPLKWRGILPGLALSIGSFGIFGASLLSALLLNSIGWRGLAAIGSLPILFCIIGYWAVPESPLWIAGRHRARVERSERAAASSNDSPGSPVLPGPRESLTGRFLLLFLAWLCVSTAMNGVYLWGPTVLAYVTMVPVHEAAAAFMIVSIAGILGKFAFSFSPALIGRRRSAQIAGFGGAAMLALGAYWADNFLFGSSVFLIGLIGATFFLEGSYANLAPFAAEMMPVRLAGRGVGIAQAGNGLGKIVGPFLLAAMAGTGDILTPKATVAAAGPAFLMLSAFALALGLIFTASRVETQGVPLKL